MGVDSVCVCVVLLCIASSGSNCDDSNTEQSNPFDKYFPHLTTEKEVIPMFRMYRWRNHPTAYTKPPPPRGRGKSTTEPSTTEEPDDRAGDYIIIPDATPVSDGHPFLDKFGKRPRKIY